MGAWAWRAAWLAAATAGAAAGWRLCAERLPASSSVPRIELLLETGHADEAAVRLAARLARDPDDSQAWLLEGRRRAEAGDFAGAAEAFGRIDKSSLYYSAAQYARAQAALRRDDAGLAEPALLAALSRGDVGGASWFNAANQLLAIWRHQDRLLESEQLTKELLARVEPERRGAARQALGGNDVARLSGKDRIAPLRKYVAANSADRESLGALALALGEDGQSEAALELLRPAMAEPALPVAVWHGQIYSLYRLQRYDELRAALDAAPADARRHPWFLRALATVRQRDGDLPGALKAIEQALAVDDTVVALNREAAALARRAGRPDLADAAEQRAEAWHRRETEMRDATKNMTDTMARRPPPAEAAAAARRLAAAAEAMMRHEPAARFRQMAAAYEELARQRANPPKP